PGALPAHGPVRGPRGEAEAGGPDQPVHGEAGARRPLQPAGDPAPLAGPPRAAGRPADGLDARPHLRLALVLMPRQVSWGTPGRSKHYVFPRKAYALLGLALMAAAGLGVLLLGSHVVGL